MTTTTIRELVNRIVYEVKNRDELDKANKSMDGTAKKSTRGARALRRFEDRIRRVGRAARRAGGFLKGMLGRIAKFTGIGAVLGSAGIVGLGVTMLKLAGDAEETRDKMRFALGDITDATEKWVRRTSNALGLNRNQVRQFVTDFSLQLQTATDKAKATD